MPDRYLRSLHLLVPQGNVQLPQLATTRPSSVGRRCAVTAHDARARLFHLLDGYSPTHDVVGRCQV